MSLEPIVRLARSIEIVTVGVVIACPPQGVDHRNEIARSAPRQRVAVRRGVLAKLVKRRSVLHRIRQRPVAARDVDRHGVGNCRPRDGRRGFLEPQSAEEIESPSAFFRVEREDARRERRNQTHAHAVRQVSGTPATQTRTPFRPSLFVTRSISHGSDCLARQSSDALRAFVGSPIAASVVPGTRRS